LDCSRPDTGEAGGKEVGQKMTHYIIRGGAYVKAYAKLKARGFQLHWQSAPPGPGKEKKSSKNKFTCPKCEQNAWAKKDAKLICGVCNDDSGEISVDAARAGR
jgi:hypothetical protein